MPFSAKSNSYPWVSHPIVTTGIHVGNVVRFQMSTHNTTDIIEQRYEISPTAKSQISRRRRSKWRRNKRTRRVNCSFASVLTFFGGNNFLPPSLSEAGSAQVGWLAFEISWLACSEAYYGFCAVHLIIAALLRNFVRGRRWSTVLDAPCSVHFGPRHETKGAHTPEPTVSLRYLDAVWGHTHIASDCVLNSNHLSQEDRALNCPRWGVVLTTLEQPHWSLLPFCPWTLSSRLRIQNGFWLGF